MLQGKPIPVSRSGFGLPAHIILDRSLRYTCPVQSPHAETARQTNPFVWFSHCSVETGEKRKKSKQEIPESLQHRHLVGSRSRRHTQATKSRLSERARAREREASPSRRNPKSGGGGGGEGRGAGSSLLEPRVGVGGRHGSELGGRGRGGRRGARGGGGRRHRGLLAGDHRVGAAAERLLVAREDTRAGRAPGVAGGVAQDWDSGQAARPRGRKHVSYPVFLPFSKFLP
jgi:hypothetical protein